MSDRVECDNCGSRGDATFRYSKTGHNFCPECASALISWWFDGGMQESPDAFAWVNAEAGLCANCGDEPVIILDGGRRLCSACAKDSQGEVL